MRFDVAYNVTRVSAATDAEMGLVHSLLRVRDPEAKKDARVTSGEWDGFHEFLATYPSDGVREAYAEFPSGLLSYVLDGLRAQRVEPEVRLTAECERARRDIARVEDLVVDPRCVPGSAVRPNPVLRDYQVEGVTRGLTQQRGVICAPPRSGKTLIALALAHVVDLPSLLLVARDAWARQHCRSAEEYGIEVTRLGGGHRFHARFADHDGPKHVIATVNTVYQALERGDPAARAWLDRVRVLQADECHFVSDSKQWTTVFRACAAPIRIGYSGTPYHGGAVWNARDMWLRGCTGGTIFEIDAPTLIASGVLVEPHVLVLRVNAPGHLRKVFNWTWLYRDGIVRNSTRNALVAAAAAAAHKGGRKVLILVAHHDHARRLLVVLRDVYGLRAVYAAGGRKFSTLKGKELAPLTYDDERLLRDFQAGAFDVLIGSTIFDQAVDIPFLTCAILAGGWKSPIHAVQRSYRCMTAADGKGVDNRPIVVDFYDNFSFVLRAHSETRITEIAQSIFGGRRDRVLEVTPEAAQRILSREASL